MKKLSWVTLSLLVSTMSYGAISFNIPADDAKFCVAKVGAVIKGHGGPYVYGVQVRCDDAPAWTEVYSTKISEDVNSGNVEQGVLATFRNSGFKLDSVVSGSVLYFNTYYFSH